ncbi:MAG: DUF4430 domain-containing protein [Patescibacteria group bacterium]
MKSNKPEFHWWFASISVSFAVIMLTALGISSYSTGKAIAVQDMHAAKIQVAVGSQGTIIGKVAGVNVVNAKVTIARSDGNTVSVELSVPTSGTVLDALTKATQVYGLVLDTKDYGEMGVLVNAIGDLSGGQDNKYWSYYVNGQAATVAVDKQIVQPGDAIEFKFEASLF